MALRAWLQRQLVAACVLALAATASAQITTGTLTGTVRDKQGGIIPGATVTVISESQNTKSSPVVTDASGDFVFPNLRADTYTVEVSMASFSTLKRSGVQVSPGERVSVGQLQIEVGGTTEVVDVKAEAPLVQSSSAERSFTISTDAVTNLPIAGRAFTQLASLAPGVTGTSRIGDRSSTGGGDTNIQMDGVSTMDTGSNRAIIDLNVESIAEVKVLVSSYQAEFGRSSGLHHGCHQERVQSLPRLGLRRRAELGLECQQQDQHPERRSEDRAAPARPGLFDRRTGRQAGWGEQAVLLLHPGVRAAHRRQ